MEITFINSEIERLRALGFKHVADNVSLTVNAEKYHKDNVDFMVLTSISLLGKRTLNNLSQYRIHLLSRTESRVVELTNIEQAKGFIARGVLAVKVENLTSQVLNITDALPITLNFMRITPVKPTTLLKPVQKQELPQTRK